MRSMPFAVLVTALFFTASAFASVAASTAASDRESKSWLGNGHPFFFVGGNLTFEKSNNERTMEYRQPLSLRGGWGFSFADVMLEFSTFNVSDGTYGVSVSRQHREWVLWAKHGFQIGRSFNPYASLGTGLQYDIIETRLGSQSVVNDGRPWPLLACAGGVEARIYKGLEANLEGRLAMSKGYAPNPMPALALLLGYRF